MQEKYQVACYRMKQINIFSFFEQQIIKGCCSTYTGNWSNIHSTHIQNGYKSMLKSYRSQTKAKWCLIIATTWSEQNRLQQITQRRIGALACSVAISYKYIYNLAFTDITITNLNWWISAIYLVVFKKSELHLQSL